MLHVIAKFEGALQVGSSVKPTSVCKIERMCANFHSTTLQRTLPARPPGQVGAKRALKRALCHSKETY